MKRSIKLLLVASTATVALAAQGHAADMSTPHVIEAPIYQEPVIHEPAAKNGWYLRGDIGYSFNNFSHADYITYGVNQQNLPGLLRGELDDAFVIGGGVGYQVTDYFRTDLTLDYMFNADFEGFTEGTCTVLGVPEACRSNDTSELSVYTLMANAYVDLGTYGRITPYVGGGIGGAKVHWGELENCITGGYDQDGCVTHGGHDEWRFAYALMAGASVDVTCNTALDVGYRYQHIQGGGMFKYAELNGFGTGPGFDDGISSHQVKAGVRFKLGGCAVAEKPPVYEPPVLPPIYK